MASRSLLRASSRTRADKGGRPLAGQLTRYAIDIAVPIGLYYLLHEMGVSNLLALSAGATVPACSALLTLRFTRRLDPVSTLVLVSFVASILASLIADNPRFLLAKEGLLTAVWGIWFLSSLAARRPAAYVFARPLMEGRRVFAAEDWEALWHGEPRFRRIWRISSVIWGTALLVDAGGRIATSYSLPIGSVPALSGLLWPVTFVVIQVVTNIYYHRAGLYRILRRPLARAPRLTRRIALRGSGRPAKADQCSSAASCRSLRYSSTVIGRPRTVLRAGPPRR